jgi:hypothetical protein
MWRRSIFDKMAEGMFGKDMVVWIDYGLYRNIRDN